MRLHRFYVSQPLGEEVVIENSLTIKQWLKVFRYEIGDFVILFNGDGYDYTCSLVTTSPSSCSLSLSEKREATLPSRKSFLFLSVIKKDLFELVAEKATEAGITDIVPLITEHTEKKNLNTERLENIIKEATEQCGRNDLPTLHDAVTFDDSFSFLQGNTVSSKNTYITTLFGAPLRDVLQKRISSDDNDQTSPIAFFVGPEGGWSDSEEIIIKGSGVTSVSLGTTVLRAETAGIYCALLSSII